MKRLAVKFLLSVGIAAFFLWLTVRSLTRDAAESIPDGDVGGALLDAVSSVGIGSILAYAALFLVVHVSRVYRWVFQVRPLGEEDTAKVFRICAVGFGAILLFPLRLGEVVRPYLLAQESDKVTFAEALGTAVVERVFDGLLITILLWLAVMTSPEPASGVIRNAGWVSLGIFAGASLALVVFVVQREIVVWIGRQTVGRISEPLLEKILGLIEGFVEGLKSLRSSGALLPFLTLTAVYWTANATGIWLLANAFGLPVSWMAGFGLLAVLVVGIMIPAGPGFFGNFQLFLGEGIKLYLPAATIGASGLALSLSMNTIQFIIQVGFAVPFLIASGMSLGRLVRVQEQAAEGAAETG